MDHENAIILGFAAIALLGVAAQWIAWRVNLPSILFLLAFGFAAGPTARAISGGGHGLLDPDAMFGQSLLLSVVSLFVGLILFEGGLSLRFREIQNVRGVVRNLVSIAIAVTWGLATLAGRYFVGLPWPVAALLGAVLVVSGPTVVMPMLRFLRPTGQLGAIIKWEGIVNDPIGALLAVLVFEAILSVNAQEAVASIAFGLGLTIVVGGGLGAVAALLLAWFISRHHIPDYLHNAVSLMLVVVAFTLSNLAQSESGLFAVTVMGVVLANQRFAKIGHIIEFKEHLRVLLISALFIVLSARLDGSDLRNLGWGSIAFVVALIVVVRPVAVFLSTWGGKLNWREKTLLAWLAPRGIVAAAVASVFALKLENEGLYAEEARLIGALAFLVIVSTVGVYGLTVAPLARWLGLSDPNPQGFLLVGAHGWGRALAERLQKENLRVVLLDSNHDNIRQARMAGLSAVHGNVLSDFLEEGLDLRGVGRLLAVTPNDEVNALASQRFERLFGRKETYQLSPTPRRGGKKIGAGETHGRTLFADHMTFGAINERFVNGEVFRVTKLTESFNFAAFREKYGLSMTPIMLRRAGGSLVVLTEGVEIKPAAGDALICLGPREEKPNEAAAKAAKAETPTAPQQA